MNIKDEDVLEKFKVYYAMIHYGGSFVKCLGNALAHADSFNAVRIKKAFPDYWQEYLNIFEINLKAAEKLIELD
jgi:hypothetical protein